MRELAEIAFSHKECEEKVATGHADDVMMRCSEIEEMQASVLVVFHAHTHTHQRWDWQIADPTERHRALETDLRLCRETLLARLGSCSRHFCWPMGFYNHDYVAIAQAQRFDYLYTTERRMNMPRQLHLAFGTNQHQRATRHLLA